MSDQVTFAHTLQFSTNVQHLLQQKGSKLRSAVMVGSHTGQGASPVEQIGAVAAQERTVRHGDTPILDTPHARRWVFPTDYEWGDMVDKQDIIRMLIDPKSPYTQAAVSAMNRKIDDVIIAAADGTATVGTISGGGNTTTEAFSNPGGTFTATSLSPLVLAEAWRRFANTNMNMEEEELYFVISPFQAQQLFGKTGTNQFTSQDFVNQKPLPNAMLPPFLGFNFIVSTRLTAVDADTTRCLAFAKSGIHLGIWNDVEVKADQRVDKGFNWQLYVRMTIGATRLENGRVMRIDIDTTAPS